MGISTESKVNLPWKKEKYLMEQKVIQMIVRMIFYWATIEKMESWYAMVTDEEKSDNSERYW